MRGSAAAAGGEDAAVKTEQHEASSSLIPFLLLVPSSVSILSFLISLSHQKHKARYARVSCMTCWRRKEREWEEKKVPYQLDLYEYAKRTTHDPEMNNDCYAIPATTVRVTAPFETTHTH